MTVAKLELETHESSVSALTLRQRDHNVDLLRAVAILLVLIRHIPQYWPNPIPHVLAFTRFGAFGVDLFFVLSGWLIGGLLWHEYAEFGDVEIGRFIGRRALRTMPPYAVALVISFAGVYAFRHQRFDWAYLIFVQNYRQQIPYFLVSWSLCVEEQFYLVMPFVALLVMRFTRFASLMFATALIAPAVFRFFFWTAGGDSIEPGGIHGFGSYYTATPLRFEGLIIGVWASYLYKFSPVRWSQLRHWAPVGAGLCFLALPVIVRLPDHFVYVLFYLFISLLYGFILCSVVHRDPVPLAASRPVYWIATTSYSMYLVHAFTLAFVVQIVHKGGLSPFVGLLIELACITVACIAFYWLVEHGTLVIRRRALPARDQSKSVLLDNGSMQSV